MARIRYQKSSKGTVELMTSAEMLAVMVAAAEAGKSYAEGISPRASGHYADSFKVEEDRRGGPRNDRAEARLVNTAAYSPAVEARHDVLARTVGVIEGHGA